MQSDKENIETRTVEIATDIDMDTKSVSDDNADESNDVVIQRVDSFISEYNC